MFSEKSEEDGSTFQLTRYQPGSLKELWAIVWPLMLAGLSGTSMVFVDRTILARYSSDAFDACAAAQPWFWNIESVLMAFVTCLEIIIGRFNGAQQYRRIGPAVWQMIGVSFASFLIIIPVAYHVRYLLADNIETLGSTYLQQLLLTLPFELAGFGAIGAFFVGRGETRKIPCVLLITSLLNCVLDIWFVFGGLGINSMGIVGAALATNIANICGFFIFLCFFLQKRYRATYAISSFCWSWNLIQQCFKIGLPNAIAYSINLTGWALIYQFFALKLQPEFYKAYCVAFTIYNFMFFAIDGMGKGVGTLCSNFLGAKEAQFISSVFQQSIRLTGIFAIFFFCILLCSKPLIQFLASKEFASDALFQKQTALFLGWYWLVFIFESVRCCIQGFMFALFKIKSVLVANVVGFWGIVLLPTYYFIADQHRNPVIYLQLIVLEHVLILSGFYLWYRRGTWRNIKKIINT